MVLRDEFHRAVEHLARASYLTVLTGAGVSKESGIPTFREAQTGLWAQYDPQELATPDAFRRNPDLVWAWYMARWNRVAGAQPNPGHRALVDLEKLVPMVTIVTQNVDGLHIRAGSRYVVELHGRLGRFKCFDNCQGDPTLIDLEKIPYGRERAPNCPYCDGKVRPDVVWFGEILPASVLQGTISAISQCDVALVVGTSGIVQPAASLPAEAKRRGATVIDVNPAPDELVAIADIYLPGPSGEVLPALVEQLKNRVGRG